MVGQHAVEPQAARRDGNDPSTLSESPAPSRAPNRSRTCGSHGAPSSVTTNTYWLSRTLSGRSTRLDMFTPRSANSAVTRASTPGPVTTGVTATIVRQGSAPAARTGAHAPAAASRRHSTTNRVRAPAKSSTPVARVSSPYSSPHRRGPNATWWSARSRHAAALDDAGTGSRPRSATNRRTGGHRTAALRAGVHAAGEGEPRGEDDEQERGGTHPREHTSARTAYRPGARATLARSRAHDQSARPQEPRGPGTAAIAREPGSGGRAKGWNPLWLIVLLALGGAAFLFKDELAKASVKSVGGGGATVRTGRAERVVPGDVKAGDVQANGYVIADRSASLASVISGRLVV